MKDIQAILPKDSWFYEFLQLWPNVEAPTTFQLFAPMCILGAALGRRCWFDNDMFKVYPMLNLLLIGPSGIGKGTSIHLGLPLLRALEVNEQPEIVTGATKEKLHCDLKLAQDTGRPGMLLVAAELANFFNKAKYMEGMIPYVTQLLDYEPYVEIRTKSGDIVRVDEPAVSVIGGSTVEWLHEQLPDSAGAGGFLARFLIVSEEYKSKRVALPGMYLDPKQRSIYDARRERATQAFKRLVRFAPQGPIQLRDYEVADVFTHWYNNLTPEVGYLAPFIERSREIVLRIAMLLSLSREQARIEVDDMIAAIQLHAIATEKLKEIVVPLSPDGKLLAAVLRAIGKGELSPKQLYSAMASLAAAPKVEMLLQSHIKSGELEMTDEGKIRRSKK